MDDSLPTIEVSRFEDSITVYFGNDHSQINAYTLASTLVGLADAAKAANASVNPGHEVEIVVEALGRGSFKATLRSVFSSACLLYTSPSPRDS